MYSLSKAFSNLGKGFKTGVGRSLRQLSSAGTYIKQKALPVVEKVAGGVSKGLMYSIPVLGAVAPELIPVALGASKLAGVIGQGAGTLRKGIQSGENAVERLKRGDVAGALSAGREVSKGAMSLGKMR
jgi:hypothetical protein